LDPKYKNAKLTEENAYITVSTEEILTILESGPEIFA